MYSNGDAAADADARCRYPLTRNKFICLQVRGD